MASCRAWAVGRSPRTAGSGKTLLAKSHPRDHHRRLKTTRGLHVSWMGRVSVWWVSVFASLPTTSAAVALVPLCAVSHLGDLMGAADSSSPKNLTYREEATLSEVAVKLGVVEVAEEDEEERISSSGAWSRPRLSINAMSPTTSWSPHRQSTLHGNKSSSPTVNTGSPARFADVRNASRPCTAARCAAVASATLHTHTPPEPKPVLNAKAPPARKPQEREQTAPQKHRNSATA